MARGARRGRRRGAHKEEESSERWLLTYADMITLLMALFMVLFSISSVNISKVQSLQESLRAAFSGDILPGRQGHRQTRRQRKLQSRALERRPSVARAHHRPTDFEHPPEHHGPWRRRRLPAAPGGQAGVGGLRPHQGPARRLRSRSRLLQERPDLDRSPGPGHQGADRRSPVRIGTGHARRPLQRPARRDLPALERRRESPHRCRGQYRQRAHPWRPLPQQLGALDRTGEHGRALPLRTRGQPRTA